MRNKRNRRSRRSEKPSPDRGLGEIQVKTPNQGIDSLTFVIFDVQGTSGVDNLRTQLIEPSRVSDEIQAWTENFEQKIRERIMKMREEMENKLDAILKEIKSSKSA